MTRGGFLSAILITFSTTAASSLNSTPLPLFLKTHHCGKFSPQLKIIHQISSVQYGKKYFSKTTEDLSSLPAVFIYVKALFQSFSKIYHLDKLQPAFHASLALAFMDNIDAFWSSFSFHLTNLRCDKSKIRARISLFVLFGSIYYCFVFTLRPKCLYLLESLKYSFPCFMGPFSDEGEEITFMIKKWIKNIFSFNLCSDPIDNHWWRIIQWKALKSPDEKENKSLHHLNQFSALLLRRKVCLCSVKTWALDKGKW